jgi:hypothetical protein
MTSIRRNTVRGGDFDADCAGIKERGDRRFLRLFLLCTAYSGTGKPNVKNSQIKLHYPYPPIKALRKPQYYPTKFNNNTGIGN